MTWTCIKCGQHNKSEMEVVSPTMYNHPRVKMYIKKIEAIEDRGEDPFSKCTYCSYDRSIKVK